MQHRAAGERLLDRARIAVVGEVAYFVGDRDRFFREVLDLVGDADR
jgi:hypothetical protein